MNRTLFALFIATLSLVVAVVSTLFILNTDIRNLSEHTGGMQGALHTIFDTVGPATVALSATKSGIDEVTTRQGTGIIVRSDGIVLTNKHLVEEGFTYTIEFQDGTKMPAQVSKIHPTYDLALLTLLSDIPLTLPVGKFINSQANVRAGDIIVSIGNTLGLYPQSIVQGIISGVNRTVPLGTTPMVGLIQTSIPVNLGNSGGPLINVDGKIIGINTGIVGGSSQIGWSLPLTQSEVDSFVR
ncbi:MAG: trypsin-like peptidase domain-containing protein [Candidatus Gracilibacteria bacterium]